MRYSIRLILTFTALLFALALPSVVCAQQGTVPAREKVAPPPGASPNSPASKTDAASGPSVAPVEGRASERVVDASIPDDASVDRMLGPYSAKVHELELVIGKLDGEMKKDGIGGGALGNFVADAIHTSAQRKTDRPIAVAITNSSGMRKNEIAAGDLRAADIYELLPFENALVTVDLTGEQLLRLLAVVVAARDAQSGARVVYQQTPDKKYAFTGAKLVAPDGSVREIDKTAVYTIVTIDYLVNRGGNYDVLKMGTNLRPLNLAIRDAVIEYVKALTAAGRTVKPTPDERFVVEVKAQTESTQP